MDTAKTLKRVIQLETFVFDNDVAAGA